MRSGPTGAAIKSCFAEHYPALVPPVECDTHHVCHLQWFERFCQHVETAAVQNFDPQCIVREARRHQDQRRRLQSSHLLCKIAPASILQAAVAEDQGNRISAQQGHRFAHGGGPLHSVVAVIQDCEQLSQMLVDRVKHHHAGPGFGTLDELPVRYQCRGGCAVCGGERCRRYVFCMIHASLHGISSYIEINAGSQAFVEETKVKNC